MMPRQVGQKMLPENAHVRLAQRERGLDEGLLLEHEHLAANDPRHGEPFGQAEKTRR